MRVIGLDIHRVFAEAVLLENGAIRRLGRVSMTRDHLTAFAEALTHDNHVVVEATGNASAVAEVIRPHVGRVVIANPRQVRPIAEAQIKTDVIDGAAVRVHHGGCEVAVHAALKGRHGRAVDDAHQSILVYCASRKNGARVSHAHPTNRSVEA